MALKSLLEKIAELFERAADKLGCDVRAARARILTRRDTGSMLSFIHGSRMIGEKKKEGVGMNMRKGTEEREEEEEEVWRRTIMMGEKCQPLEFSGVIYYDADGKRLLAAARSPLPGNTLAPRSLYCS